MNSNYSFHVILAVSTVFCPSLLAAGSYPAGDGTAESPYQILTAADLIELGKHPEDYDKYFILMADIDLGINAPDGKVFRQAVIAPDTDPNDTFHGTAFSGTFDGNDHIIQNLTIEFPEGCNVGLFGKLSPTATVINLGMESVDLTHNDYSNSGAIAAINHGWIVNCYSAGSIRGDSCTGGLVGINYSEIIGCHTAGLVEGSSSNSGGLVGLNLGGFIQKSSSACYINGWRSVGGLVGESTVFCVGDSCYWSLISYCYATGYVTGSESYIGGLVGYNHESYLYNCYATGSVSGNQAVGGLVGFDHDEVINCYSTGWVTGDYVLGGLIGSSSSLSAENSFWDKETSDQLYSDGGTGLLTWQMMAKSTFTNAGWDFDTVWDIVEGGTYPFFQWQTNPSVIICRDGLPYPAGDLNEDCIVDILDFAILASNWLLDERP